MFTATGNTKPASKKKKKTFRHLMNCYSQFTYLMGFRIQQFSKSTVWQKDAVRAQIPID